MVSRGTLVLEIWREIFGGRKFWARLHVNARAKSSCFAPAESGCTCVLTRIWYGFVQPTPYGKSTSQHWHRHHNCHRCHSIVIHVATLSRMAIQLRPYCAWDKGHDGSARVARPFATNRSIGALFWRLVVRARVMCQSCATKNVTERSVQARVSFRRVLQKSENLKASHKTSEQECPRIPEECQARMSFNSVRS